MLLLNLLRQEIWLFDTDEGYLGDIWGPDLFCLMPPPTPHFSEGAGNEETETDFHLNFSFRLSQENSSQF